MNPFDQQSPIKGVNKIFLVGSGKGGVGKSTVTVNLAKKLAQKGYKVGVLDADIYGPSIPRMLGALNQKPETDASKKIYPIERQGLKLMSIGFMVPEDQALVWRGPMLFKAMDQFFRDVAWGDLDYLFIDLPPGTGDVALTIAQKVPVDGAFVVMTPQNMALADAKKAIDMFERINVKVVGAIENMSYLRSDLSSEPIFLFPKGDLDTFLKSKGIPKIAEIPFHTHVALSSEMGIPFVESYPESLESIALGNALNAIL